MSVEDEAIAAALAETWAECWDDFERGGGDDPAARAVSVYALTTRALNDQPQDASPRRSAVMAVRELADGYALVSHEWSETDLGALDWPQWPGVPLPTRAQVEWRFRETGIVEWCERLGRRLELAVPFDEVEQVATQVLAAAEAHDDRRADGIVRTLGESLAAYRGMRLGLVDASVRAGVLERRESLRHDACRHLALTRKWAAWVLERMGFQATLVMTVLWLLSQSTFVAAAAADEDALERIELPSEAVIAWLLRQEDTERWLAQHGAEIPDWLDLEQA